MTVPRSTSATPSARPATGWPARVVRTPRAGEEAAALAWARAQAPLVLLSASVAARIGDAGLRAALAALAPLVLIVPDLHGEVPLPGPGGAAARATGAGRMRPRDAARSRR